MSSIASKWARRQVVEDRTVRAVLVAIAESAKGDTCELTQPKIAEKAGIKERATRNAISLLEGLGLLTKRRKENWSKLGRSADLITLSIEHDFTISKECIVKHRSMGPTGTKSWDQPAPYAGAPNVENPPSLYKERARSVLVDSSPSQSPLGLSTRVRFDRGRQKWRATIMALGVTMDLGRFDTEDEAKAYAAQSEADVARTATSKARTPTFPVVHPSKANLDAPALGAWLFGDSVEGDSENGVGVAGARGQGTKFLAGVWGEKPHEEPSEQDAARASFHALPARAM